MNATIKKISMLVIASAISILTTNAEQSVSLSPTLGANSAYSSLILNEDGSYSITFNNTLGDSGGDTSFYYDWNGETLKVAESDDYDIYATANASTNKYTKQSTANASVSQSFIGVSTGHSSDGGALYVSKVTDSITGDFINNSDGSIYIYRTYVTSIESNFIGNYMSDSIPSGDPWGGAIYIEYGTGATGITGDFIGNYVYSDNDYAYDKALGGAIAVNYENSSDDIMISSITGDFIGNYAYSTDLGETVGGGAIYIYNAISGDITGNFIGNSVENMSTNYDSYSNNTAVYGGAIYLAYKGDICDINGSFIGNSASSAEYAHGGAIALDSSSSGIGDIVGDFINNTVTVVTDGTYDRAFADGGAIYNAGSITSITGDFINNSVSGTSYDYSVCYGGAIYNYSNGSFDYVTGSFENNSVTSISYGTGTYGATYSAQAFGGAIYKADIDYITGDFTNNYVKAQATSLSAQAYGGAIYTDDYTSNIKGDFSGNYALADGYTLATAIAGAICDSGTIDYIEGDFSKNNATATSQTTTATAYAGAIYVSSSKTIKGIESDFSSNYALADGYTSSVAAGGAIFNSGTIEYITGSFTDNYAKSTSDDAMALGGAIYNSNTLTISATGNSTYTNINNYATTDDVIDADDDQNGGFLYNDEGTTTFYTESVNSSIIIGDGTAGYDSIAGTGEINKTGSGSLIVNSSMVDYTGTLNVNAGIMEVNNGLGASSINILSGATLSATINGDYTFSNDSLTVSNDGTLKLIAGVGLDSDSYTIATNTDLDFDSSSIGAIAYGGTIDGNTFTVSASEDFEMSVSSATTVTDNGRIVIDTSSSTSSSVESVVMSFNSESATLTSVTDVLTNLESAITISSTTEVLAAFDFDITLTSGDSVVLSFLVGSGYDLSEFTIYHSTDNESWDVASEISDLTYDGEYLSFIVTSFSAYGVAVPEPSTYAMIFGALALGLAVYRRRK